MRSALTLLLFLAFSVAPAAGGTQTQRPRIPSSDILKSPSPRYPYEARKHHITGWGVWILHIDRASGTVTSVTVNKSTGHKILDDAAVEAFLQWRFKPGVLKNDRIWMPASFFMFDEPAGINAALQAEKRGIPPPSGCASWCEFWQEQIASWTDYHHTDCADYFHKRRKALGLEDLSAH